MRQEGGEKETPPPFFFLLPVGETVSIHLLYLGWGAGCSAGAVGMDAVGTRCGGAAASCQPRLCPATRPRSICRSRNEPSRPLAQASSRSPIHPHPSFSVLLFFPNGLTIALPVAFTAAVRPAGESLNLCFKLKGLL